ILKGSADDNVTLYQGTEIGLLNAYFVRKGHMQDLDGQIDLKTSGYGYNLSGFLSLFSLLTKDPSFSNLSEYINIRYNYALESTVESDGPRDNTVYKELTFSLNNPQKFLSFLGKKNVTWFGGYLVSDLWHPPDQGAYSSLQGFDVGVELPNLFGGGGLITGFRFAQMGFALNGVEHFFNTQLSINFHLNYLRTYLAKPFQLFQFQFLLGAEFGYLINIDSRTTLCNSEGECEFSTASISGHDWRQYYNGNYEDVGLIAGMRIPLSARLFIGTQYYHGFTNVLNPVDAQNQSLTAGLYIKI
ncbi:MAG: hypothetical protein ACE5D7_00070, partial [Fidelibacterota bacterium]